MSCRHCKRALRPVGTTLAEYPGTLITAAKGLCGACYRRQRLNHGSLAQGDDAPAKVDYLQSPCVLVRVDLTPATYKALTAAKVDIAAMMAAHADRVASVLPVRAA